MPSRRSVADGTEPHTGPTRLPAKRGREVLIAVYPETRVLPVPVTTEPLGRDWLVERGVNDARVSTRHLAFHRSAGTLHVEDLGSRNGSFANGERLRPSERVPITDGAVLRVGRTIVVYRESFFGPETPSPPLGQMVGPYGLRPFAADVDALRARKANNVLIEGETGTGKELAAKYVASMMGRASRYDAVNVAGVPAGVFESQLFGYVPGAYSGAGRGSRGIIAEHDGGAVFLDELGELPLELQPKLLRLLENREILPVGATKPSTVDVLLVAATNRALDDMVEQGTFRRDLLARLASGRVELPALRDRAEDIFEIARALRRQRGVELVLERVEVETVERLLLYPWHTNVRELQTILDRAAKAADPTGLPYFAVEQLLGPLPTGSTANLTADAVQRALANANGNQSEAARALGISRGKLLRLLKT